MLVALEGPQRALDAALKAVDFFCSSRQKAGLLCVLARPPLPCSRSRAASTGSAPAHCQDWLRQRAIQLRSPAGIILRSKSICATPTRASANSGLIASACWSCRSVCVQLVLVALDLRQRVPARQRIANPPAARPAVPRWLYRPPGLRRPPATVARSGRAACGGRPLSSRAARYSRIASSRGPCASSSSPAGWSTQSVFRGAW